MAAPVAMDEATLLAALRQCGGHSGFRNGQLDAIRATLSGQDSLLILPTGGGKSLTFQVPPVARGNCFTVVISPLLALAYDQVEKCLENGIEAALWNSSISDAQRSSVLSELASDEPGLRLLYTTPESLLKPALRDALKEAHASGTLCAFAIDEAHCISEWGHDFRPAYLQLASLKEDFPGVPIAALTASATPRVQASIISCLGLKEPQIITASFNRPNIALTVRHKALIGAGTDDDVIEDLLAFIAERPGQCGIVYARLRSTCDRLASVLSGADVDVAKYHAGLDSGQRAKVMRDWAEGSVDVVVATIAFGMGIDRSDVRWVIHYNLPSSVEGLYQECGRAGRDGVPSVSLVYESLEDAETVGRMERGNRQGSMAAVADLFTAPGCRRKRLLAFFGEKRGPCDPSCELPCDWCTDPTAARRRLAEREERVGARLQAVRQRELGLNGDGGDGGGGSGSGSDGGGGDSDAEGSGEVNKKGSEKGAAKGKAAGGGWGSAALLGRSAAAGPALRRPLLSVVNRGGSGVAAGASGSNDASASAAAKAPSTSTSQPTGAAGGAPVQHVQTPGEVGASTEPAAMVGAAAMPARSAGNLTAAPALRVPGLLPRLHKRPRGGSGGAAAALAPAAHCSGTVGSATGVASGSEAAEGGAGAVATAAGGSGDGSGVASAAAAVQPHPLSWRLNGTQGAAAAARRAFKPPLRRAPPS